MYSRKLQIKLQAQSKSILLLGPRQCGKSTLIRGCEPELRFNMARESEFLQFSSDPGELENQLARKRPKTVFIDEIQRLPTMLNTIQAILDESNRPPQFFLTGSSARKLKKGQANLLPGRVRVYHLGPIFWEELGDEKIPLTQLLSTGTMPGVLSDRSVVDREKTLRDYAGTYLKEEVQAEALARDIEGFSRFLKVAGACAAEFMDLTKMASEAQIKRLSAIRYFEILEDTLIVERVQAFAKSERRRLLQHPKFFFFDVGVWNGLLGNFEVSADRIGRLFEHFIYNQISAAAKAHDRDIRVSTYRTEHGAEVDFIVEVGSKIFALEVKASKNVGASDMRGFESFKEFYGKKFHPVVATLSSASKVVNGVPVLPWDEALAELGIGG
jgi:predicted AAA+ superfamily ATPase